MARMMSYLYDVHFPNVQFLQYLISCQLSYQFEGRWCYFTVTLHVCTLLLIVCVWRWN